MSKTAAKLVAVFLKLFNETVIMNAILILISLLCLIFFLEVVFIALSLMIAIFVMIESTLLERNGGKLLLKNSIFMFISLSTSAWMVAACLAWYFFWILSVWAWW